MAHCLLWGYISDSQHPHKSWRMWVLPLTPVLWRQGQGSLGQAGQAGFSEGLCLFKESGEQLRKTTDVSTSGLHTWTHHPDSCRSNVQTVRGLLLNQVWSLWGWFSCAQYWQWRASNERTAAPGRRAGTMACIFRTFCLTLMHTGLFKDQMHQHCI